MTTAQLTFSIALGIITLIITFFAIYVVSTTFWADRWTSKSTGRAEERGPNGGIGSK